MNVEQWQDTPTVEARVSIPGRPQYRVAVRRQDTVIDVLESIRSTVDPSLDYRHSCHHGSCGTCGMEIQGRPTLACLCRIDDLVDQQTVATSPGGDTGRPPTDDSSEHSGLVLDLNLRPLPYGLPLHDLAIDQGPLFEGFPPDAAYRRTVEPAATLPASDEPLLRFEDCIECGICVSVCPAPAFAGPAALAALYRQIVNNPVQQDELIAIAAAENGVAGCRQAFECSRACPMAVAPGRKIADLRRMVARRLPRGGSQKMPD